MTEIDPQDPLPEPTWLWRRLYVYGISLAFLGLLWLAVNVLADVAPAEPADGIEALVTVAKWLILALICVLTFYLVAPSAEQIVKMIQAARIKKEASADPAPPPPSHEPRRPKEKTPWE